MNFRFAILDFGLKPQRKAYEPISFQTFSENRKPVPSTYSGHALSHAEGFKNPKWLGLSVTAFVLVVTGAVAQAQQPKRVPRIGYLSVLDPSGESSRAETIRLALREIGYVEGQNIIIEYRYAEGKRERFPELAAELVRLKVDIILAPGGATAIRAAKNATTTIPIIMLGQGSDPIEGGLVKSLAQPGGNVTGLTLLSQN